MTLLILLTVVALGAIAGLAVVAMRSQRAPAPTLVGRTVIVHTRRPDDQSIRGVLTAEHADRLTLRDVQYISADGNHDVADLAHIPTANVAWMQELVTVEVVG